MHALATSVETYMQEPGGLRLRGVVGTLVVAAHLALIVWVMLPGSPPATEGVESMQMVFIPPPEQKETPPPPAPKVEQPPVLTSKRVVEAAPTAPVIPPEPAPEAPAAEPVQESTPPAPPSPPVAAAPVEVPVNVRAAYANNPKPNYPPISRRLNEQGTVRLRLLVSPDGRVQQIEMEKSSGYSRLDQATMAAVRDWKFAPARRGDGAVSSWVTFPFTWKLDK